MSLSSKKCCVPGCMDKSHTLLPLHLFPNPIKDKKRYDTWIFSIGGDLIGMDSDDIYKHRRVCHAHFEKKFHCRYDRLSNIAVPTLYLPGPLCLPKFSFAERRPLRQLDNMNPTKQPMASGLFESQIEASLESSSATWAADSAIEMENIPTTTENTATSKENTGREDDSMFAPTTSCAAAGVILNENTGLLEIQIEATPESSRATWPFVRAKNIAAATENADKENESMSAPTTGSVAAGVLLNENKDKENESMSAPTTGSVAAGVLLNENKGRAQKKTRIIASKKVFTASEHKLYQKVVKMRSQLSKYRSKVKKQSASLKAAKKLTSNPAFIAAIDKLPNTAKILTMLQLREVKKKDKGRRFSVKEKIIALSILKQSPKCYRFLRKIFILPAPQTLTKLISQANVKPGINKKIFLQIKEATATLKVEDRLCVLLFDEMSLKANITYNERKDRVIGFVTDGQTTKPEYADHAQVFMIRGVTRNFKQPVSYTFSAGATSGPDLAKQLKEVIKELQAAGIIVVATICDQGTNNRSAIKLLVQETRGDFIRSGREPKENVFVVNEQEIITLYDPPHLIKCIRNNLVTKNLTYKSSDNLKKTAKWQHIELLHQENPGYKGIRLIPKLTENHVIPSKMSKMKVKYATQIFSQTVSSNMGYLADKGILPNECKDTADILLFFDKLFDSMNGSYMKKGIHGKPLLGPVRPNSVHNGVWNEAKKQLKHMTFVNIATGKAEKVPSIENWVWTLDSVQILVKKLHNEYDITSVWMRHLNQDPLENFFGAIRSHGCRNTNPTTERFESAYTSLLINNMSSVHAPGANCEMDYCDALHTLILADDCQPTETSNLESIPDVQIIKISEKNDPRVMGALQFVSGYFVHKAQKNVFKNCKECLKDTVASQENDYLKKREYAGRRWLVSPSESLLSCISAVQDINNEILKKNLSNNNLKELIKTIVFIFVNFAFLNCKNHKDKLINYVINLSCRFFIYNYCKDINKILKGRRDCNDDEDIFQLKAKKYYHKCFKRRNK